jgi:hypothetical protein
VVRLSELGLAACIATEHSAKLPHDRRGADGLWSRDHDAYDAIESATRHAFDLNTRSVVSWEDVERELSCFVLE